MGADVSAVDGTNTTVEGVQLGITLDSRIKPVVRRQAYKRSMERHQLWEDRLEDGGDRTLGNLEEVGGRTLRCSVAQDEQHHHEFLGIGLATARREAGVRAEPVDEAAEESLIQAKELLELLVGAVQNTVGNSFGPAAAAWMDYLAVGIIATTAPSASRVLSTIQESAGHIGSYLELDCHGLDELGGPFWWRMLYKVPLPSISPCSSSSRTCQNCLGIRRCESQRRKSYFFCQRNPRGGMAELPHILLLWALSTPPPGFVLLAWSGG